VYIIVGLGNPGSEYKDTRHNVGFMALDTLVRRFHLKFKQKREIFESVSFNFDNQAVLFVKPRTFMNRSGVAVKTVLQKYEVSDLSRLLIVCDDFNLPFGTLRLRPTGSHGGQKGLQSIISMLGTQDFPRLRIGIGDDFTDAVEYVLSPFSKNERKDLPIILNWAADAIESFILNGIELTMSRYNRNFLEN